MIKQILSIFTPKYLKKLVENAKDAYERDYAYYMREITEMTVRYEKLRKKYREEEDYLTRIYSLRLREDELARNRKELMVQEEIFNKTKKEALNLKDADIRTFKDIVAEKDAVIKNLRETIDKLIKTIESPKLSVVK